MTWLRGDPRCRAHIFKRSITTIVVQDACCRAEFAGRAIHRLCDAAARLALFWSPVEIAGYEEIKVSIVVVIKESGRGRPTTCSYTSFGRHVSEGPIAVVVVKKVSPEICDVDVGEPIVIVVSDSDSHAVVCVASVLQSGLHRDVGEGAVFVLTVEPIPVGGIVAIKVHRTEQRISNMTCVYEKNVQKPIIVVVE